ncbi:MAG: alcohol dehydrogenase catalytic domain-containing protein [Planctomycetales bacterium]
MKAWLVDHFGPPEEMTFGETPVPEPGPQEVRIKHRAAALNFFDLLLVQGKYQEQPPFPFTPGAEAAGVIDAVGSEVKHLAVGQKVIAFVNRGDTGSSRSRILQVCFRCRRGGRSPKGRRCRSCIRPPTAGW